MRTSLASAVLLLASACSTPPQAIPFDIRPVAPALTSGTGRATLTAQGDLALDVSVHGPADEISRSDTRGAGQSNFLWHLLEGTCTAWQRNEQGHTVLARWSVDPQRPDASEFHYVIPHGDLDTMSRPHALAAFRNGGGGPLYACGDLPVLSSR
jgi:hypothetical protein